jgi:hypothetical protein
MAPPARCGSRRRPGVFGLFDLYVGLPFFAIVMTDAYPALPAELLSWLR